VIRTEAEARAALERYLAAARPTWRWVVVDNAERRHEAERLINGPLEAPRVGTWSVVGVAGGRWVSLPVSIELVVTAERVAEFVVNAADKAIAT
jgi:hypothetical protein